MEWISTKDKLPDDGQTVLVYDGNVRTANIVFGISKQTREDMKAGKIPDPESWGWNLSQGYFKIKRSDSFGAEDEWWNNEVPYCWKDKFSPMTWFGQNIKYWMPLPEPPKEELKKLEKLRMN